MGNLEYFTNGNFEYFYILRESCLKLNFRRFSHSNPCRDILSVAPIPEQLDLLFAALFFEWKAEEQLRLFLRRQHMMRDEKFKGLKVEDIFHNGSAKTCRG